MTEHRLPSLTETAVDLGAVSLADERLWITLLDLSDALNLDEWVLIGGQMVALLGYAAGRVPPRFSRDLDVLANLALRPTSLRRCASQIARLGFTPQPSADDRRLHRFVRDELVVDVVAPDHPPQHLLPLRLGGRDAVTVDGGWRALQTAAVVPVRLGDRPGTIPIPDLRGSLVIKARAARGDRRDRERHLTDIAFLCSLVDDPRRLREQMTARDRSHLRRVALSRDPRDWPWVVLPDVADRSDAVDAFLTLIA